MPAPKDEGFELITSRQHHLWYTTGEPAPLFTSLHLTDNLDPFPSSPVHFLQLLGPFVFWAAIRLDPLAGALRHPLFSQAGQLGSSCHPTQLRSHSKYGQ